ncbi:uncharacterized protein PRCAT00001785001 [Priceomyces carsonii]|uniref:uncharacterized protein n=1 Tax=Priceomyces carsonii TaxID=28549 RepID=UPI002EDA6860|nr:unnamed protein product [Priceomyces carsonii]
MSPIQLSDKDLLLANDLENNGEVVFPLAPKKSPLRKVMNFASIFMASVMGLMLLSNQVSNELTLPVAGIFGFLAPKEPALAVVNIFEIETPLNAVTVASSQVVFNDTLVDGLSGKFKTSEDLNYTGAFLTLNLTNNLLENTTTPLVFEITADEYPIWRSSAPFGKDNTVTVSSTTKNVSEYLSLFESKRSFAVSILEGDATGIDIILEVSLTNDTIPANDKPFNPSDIFIAEGPASSVFALSKAGKPYNLPNTDKFSISLPQLSTNSTAAKIEFFASASNEEKDYFKTETAPLRYLNVFVNDVYVGSVNPKPVLYHPEGLSEDAHKNFDPLVDYGTFTGLTYEINLLSVLPLLWEGDATVDVYVVSPTIDFTPGIPALPKPITKGANEITADSWFISGNLLAWESQNVTTSSGVVVDSAAIEITTGVLTSPPPVSPWTPKIKNEFVKDLIVSNVSSIVNFEFSDNTTVTYNITANSSINSILTKQEKSKQTKVGPPFGAGPVTTTDSLSLVLINNNKLSFDIVDNSTALSILSYKSESSFPVTLDITTKSSPVEGNSTDLRCDIKSKSSDSINGTIVNDFEVKEHLSSSVIIGLLTDVKYTDNDFKREVQVVNGVETEK